VSSESTHAFALVSSSAFAGNAGAGVRATFGNVPVVVAHCVVAGNPGGGVVSEQVESVASSSVAWMQPSPWTGTRAHFDVDAFDPLDPPFTRAPVEYRRATAFDGAWLTLDSTASLAIGDAVELADDGIERAVASFAAGERCGVVPSPQSLALPALLARFAQSGSVAEDYTLSPTSPAGSAGMPDSSGSADAGPFGAARGGAPGRDELDLPALFRPARSTPALAQTLTASQSIRIAFTGGALDALTVTSQTVRARGPSGSLLAPSVSVQAGELVVAPPGGGWPSGALTIELHGGLQATDATPIAAPAALAYRVQ